jgi:hypothetical protein
VHLQRTNPVDKPVLDEGMFQQLLAAAYTLQEQNDHALVEKAKANPPWTLLDEAVAEKVQLLPPVSIAPEPLIETERPVKPVLPMARSSVRPAGSLNDSLLHPETVPRVPDLAQGVLRTTSVKRTQSKPAQPMLPVHRPVPAAKRSSCYGTVRRRISHGNELFWKVTTVAAITAVLVLLLGTSIDSLSPLPAGLALTSEEFRQQVPFQRATPIVTVLARSGADTKTIAMEPQATNTRSPEQTVAPKKAAGGSTTPASAKKTAVSPNLVASAYESEADVVAPDTVTRYKAGSAAPYVQVQKKP